MMKGLVEPANNDRDMRRSSQKTGNRCESGIVVVELSAGQERIRLSCAK
jgi:hypothetical protein